MKISTFNVKWGTVVAVYAGDESSHLAQWSDDASHRTALNGSVSRQFACKILSCQNTGDQSGSRSAVSDIQHGIRLLKSVETLAVYQDFFLFVFNVNSHFAETVNGRKTVSAL